MPGGGDGWGGGHASTLPTPAHRRCRAADRRIGRCRNPLQRWGQTERVRGRCHERRSGVGHRSDRGARCADRRPRSRVRARLRAVGRVDVRCDSRAAEAAAGPRAAVAGRRGTDRRAAAGVGSHGPASHRRSAVARDAVPRDGRGVGRGRDLARARPGDRGCRRAHRRRRGAGAVRAAGAAGGTGRERGPHATGRRSTGRAVRSAVAGRSPCGGASGSASAGVRAARWDEPGRRRPAGDPRARHRRPADTARRTATARVRRHRVARAARTRVRARGGGRRAGASVRERRGRGAGRCRVGQSGCRRGR